MRSLLMRPGALVLGLVALIALASCGGTAKKSAPGPIGASKPQPFPRASGGSLTQLLANLPEGPILGPSVGTLEPGATNRFGFVLFDRARKQIGAARVAIYTASATGNDTRGPYMARSESLAVQPQFESRTVAQDPDAGKGIYVADIPLARAPNQLVVAIAQLDGRLVSSSLLPVTVTRAGPPDVGDRAIRIHTPTSPPAPIQSIDTRVPPDSMHGVDFAKVLGRKPIVLVFATPQLCQKRVCGPIVDEAEQLNATYGSRVAFIHMEVYKNNRLEDGLRPQLDAWHLRSEPWVFAIDRHGKIVARLEGAASVEELEQAVQRALKS